MNKFEIIGQTERNMALENYVEYVLKKLSLDNVIFNIILIDNKKMAKLNKDYRNIDGPTDVLAFALEDNKRITFTDFRLLGDIYISLEYIRKQALEYQTTFDSELRLMITHGILHLIGYDHKIKKDEKEMFKIQELIVSEYQ